ncbi:uncharacterized protein LOC119988834 [Tripterygium wilfordii]|uniref:uncharacterized protein LOC119988834 n=1 Tax=Tripterygium wilfordii TaxID=458696 RepID=UPI0018F7F9D4|nr:uncharacterized protein LOC119988834 [Tripterygium wilfordii]
MENKSGVTTKIWLDPWIPGQADFKPIVRSDVLLLQNEATVDSLLLTNPLRWNIPLLGSWFEPGTVRNILKIHLPASPSDDRWVWTLSHSGSYSVKIAYHSLNSAAIIAPSLSPLSSANWNKIWQLKVHARFQLLLWKSLWNMLPTRGMGLLVGLLWS